MAIDGRRPPDPPDPSDENRLMESGRRRYEATKAAAEIEGARQFGSRVDHARQLDQDQHQRQTWQAEQRPDQPMSGGAGGDWEIHDEVPDSAVKQLTKSSCVAACGEMLVDSKLSQESILSAIDEPASCARLGRHLRESGQGDWVGGYIEPVLSRVLSSGKPWAAELFPSAQGPNRIQHMVIIDRMDDETVGVRDPWEGSSYTMSRKEFSFRWTGNGVFLDKGGTTENE